MLINLTNHPSALWSAEQTEAAAQFGEIRDLPFPAVSPTLTDAEMNALVETYERQVLSTGAETVLLQGEFVFLYRLTVRLKQHGIRVVSAVSERKAVETQQDGKTVKQSEFRFCGFRAF